MSNGCTNIAGHLTEMARAQPKTDAVICVSGGRRLRLKSVSFQQLDQLSDRIAAGLRANGVERSTRVALMVPPGESFFAITFGLFKLGAIPVLIDPGIGIGNLAKCLQEAAPGAFIGIPKAQLARVLFRWARATIETVITVGPRFGWGGTSFGRILRDGVASKAKVEPLQSDDVAAILFTSGSTGVPKGVVYTHSNFQAQITMLRSLFDIAPGEMDLSTFPLFALFSPALGMTSVIPQMDPTRPAQVRPENIFGALNKLPITNMFGSPALLNRIGRAGLQSGVSLPRLRRVISAGAPASPAVLERFTRLLSDGVQIHTPYGATEALPVSSIGSHEILGSSRTATERGEGVCVGKPASELDVRVIGISDEPIASWSDSLQVANGRVGEICVAGNNVTREYFNRVESTKLAKIVSTRTFYHRMGDLGYFDGAGRLWFCGRKAHRVEAAEATFYTVACEGVFNAHPKVYRTALVGVGQPGNQHPVLCVELEREHRKADRQTLEYGLRKLGERFEHTSSIRTFLFHHSFPVDIRHNAKIFREKLSVWATDQI